jgi:hypothetical protein
MSGGDAPSPAGALGAEMKVYATYLIGAGCCFLSLGVLLMMDAPLLALGNIQLLLGLVGYFQGKFMGFFFSRDRIGFSALFFVGVALVLAGFAAIGILFELAGLLLLFWGLVQTIISVAKTAFGMAKAVGSGMPSTSASS